MKSNGFVMEIVKILTETNFLGNEMKWNHKKIYYTIIWFLERKKNYDFWQ